MYSESTHNRLIDIACQNGWSRRGWKAAVRKSLSRPPWNGYEGTEVIECVNAIRCIPDGWRIKVEGPGGDAKWSYDVLVLELLEVEVTHPIDQEKLQQYEWLWWQLDGTSRYHLRVFRMDRYGFVVPFMAEGGVTIRHLLRHGPAGKQPVGYYEVPWLNSKVS